MTTTTAAAPTTTNRRALRVLLAAFASANLADGLTLVLLPLMAVSTTQSALEISLIAVARTAPWAVLASAIGVLIERLPLRAVMVWAVLLRGLILGALGAVLVFGELALWHLVVAAFVLGIGEACYDISAQSALPSIVASGDLERANARQATIAELLQGFLGPASAGVLVLQDLRWGAFAAGLCYLVTAVQLNWLPALAAPATQREGFWREFVAGLRAVWGDPLLRVFLVMTACGAVAFAGWLPMFSLHAVAPGPMGLDSLRFGLLFSLAAAGDVLGSLLVPRLVGRVSRTYLVTASVAVGALSLLAPALSTSFALVGAALAVYSATVIVWNVITVSYRQRRLPRHLLGRVNATYRALAWGLLPVGPLLSGFASDLAGAPSTGLISMAILAALALLAVPMVLRYKDTLDRGKVAERPGRIGVPTVIASTFTVAPNSGAGRTSGAGTRPTSPASSCPASAPMGSTNSNQSTSRSSTGA